MPGEGVAWVGAGDESCRVIVERGLALFGCTATVREFLNHTGPAALTIAAGQREERGSERLRMPRARNRLATVRFALVLFQLFRRCAMEFRAPCALRKFPW